MKKLTRILMMMLVLSVGTGITSCDEIEDMIDNPVVPEPQPEPTPEPTPQPTPEEIENQRIAEAQALLEESRQEGALVKLTYTVNGVERVASFKRVGDKYVLQNPSSTRADGAEGDEYVPYLMDYDTDEDPENDKDLDDADLDKDIEEEFEYEDGDDDLDDDDLDDDDNLDDDDTENLDNDAIADQLEWDDTTDDDDDDDAADGEDDDEATAGTRAMKQEIPYKYCCSIAGFRGITTLADCTQALLMPRTATFTQSFAIVAENFRTRSQEPVMAFTGKIEVNGKTFTYKPSEAGTRASNSKTVKVKSAGNMRITNVVFKKLKNLIYKYGNIMKVQVVPTNAKVKKVKWKSENNLKLASLHINGYHKIISTCKVTPNKKKKMTITCTVKGKNSKSKSYKVKVVYATVKGVTISPSSLTFTEGDQPKQLKATVTPSNANPSVIWKSDKEDVAIVDKNGNVTPKGVGTATITCTSVDNSQKTATCTVTVNAAEVPISSLKLSQTSLSLFVGGTATLTAEVNENATVDKIVTWSVSKGTAVTVDQTGKVTAVAAGDATITAKAGEKTATCTVTVSKKAGSISFKESTVNVDNTASPFTNTLTNTGDGAVTYKSSDDSVAKVDADGKVTLMGTGTGIIITATVADSDTYHYDTNEVRYTINVSALPSNIAEPIDYGHEDSPF